MAYYEDGGEGGRFGKNFDGPVGPRRPRMFEYQSCFRFNELWSF
jgi:hypothetical protein